MNEIQVAKEFSHLLLGRKFSSEKWQEFLRLEIIEIMINSFDLLIQNQQHSFQLERGHYPHYLLALFFSFIQFFPHEYD